MNTYEVNLTITANSQEEAESLASSIFHQTEGVTGIDSVFLVNEN